MTSSLVCFHSVMYAYLEFFKVFVQLFLKKLKDVSNQVFKSSGVWFLYLQ